MEMRQNSGADWEEWYKPAGAVMHVFGRSLWRGFSVLLFAGDENKGHSSHSMSAPVLRIARFKHLLSRQHVSSTADSPHPPPSRQLSSSPTHITYNMLNSTVVMAQKWATVYSVLFKTV